MVTRGPKAHWRLAVVNSISPALTAGIDVGDKYSHVCVLDDRGEVAEQTRLPTSKPALKRAFAKRDAMRVALEVGVHSPWMSDILQSCGHEVIVANARELERITKSDRKNDENDAELLARLARVDPKLLSPITHRAKELREDLAVLRARDTLVASRTKLVNCVRGIVKGSGTKLPKCSPEAFPKRVAEHVPTELAPAVEPLLSAIADLTGKVRDFDKRIEKLAAEKYPESQLLQQVAGVGPITALAFMLTVADRKRFKKSRDVGPYFGLVPKQQKSSTVDPQLKITKAGNPFVRRLLVSSAHCVLRRNGSDSNIRRWGLSLAARGGKNAKKRAVVAVARKLAVLLHKLWSTGQVYEPLHVGTKSATKDVTSNANKKKTS
jgi:transposase